MPAIWSSSERPISVRMVWVDGIRHAILSQDDPFLKAKGATRRRPQTTSAVKDKNYPLKFEPYKSSTQTDVGCFEGCFVKLRVVVEKSGGTDSLEASARSLIRQKSAPVCSRVVKNSLEYRAGESFESSDVEVYQSDNYESDVSCRDSSEDKEKEIARKIEEEPKRTETPQLSTLSERVLQWLDLSGKAHDYEFEDAKREPSDSQEKPVAVLVRRKHSNFKEEGTFMKIVVPTQYVMLQETKDVGRERRAHKTKSAKREAARKASVDSESNEEASKRDAKVSESGEADEKSPWTPPGKPQLHIFMPSLKSTEIQWMSSQESLVCE